MLNFQELFAQSYFNYPDLIDNLDCNMRSHNSLFSALLCGLRIDSISKPIAIFIAFLLNSLKDLITLYIATSLISKRAAILFCVFLAMHPYLAVYHAKLTTDVFAGLAVTFLLFKIFRKYAAPWIELAIVFLLSGLRNSTIPMLGVFSAIHLIRQSKKRNLKVGLIYFMCGLSTVFFFFLPEELYSTALADSTKEYPFSIEYFKTIFDFGSGILATAVSSVFVLLSHAILLLGFREAVFTNFPEIFIPLTPIVKLQLLIFTIMFFVHLIGLVYFFLNYFRKQTDVLLLFLIIFPGFLFVAHLRYFLPLIPVALWGFAIFCDVCLTRINTLITFHE